MRLCIIFTILLLTSKILPLHACGPYYPEKETFRMHLINPSSFLVPGYAGFAYSSAVFGVGDSEITAKNENVKLWKALCNNAASESEIYEVVYGIVNANEKNTSNKFVKFLQAKGNEAILEYLNFAIYCNNYNSYGDPWEESTSDGLGRIAQIEKAHKMAKASTNAELKRRYAFLAIRMAYYESASSQIQSLYKEFFADRKEKNLIDYWAMSFMACTLDSRTPEANYFAAQVFANAPDKRLNMYYNVYSRTVDVTQTLALASTAEEKSAIWAMESVANPAKGIEILKIVYSLTPNSEILDFLLLREINKLEDWVYTPYYTAFKPTVSENYWNGIYEDISIEKRLKSDRAYAQQLLDFLNTVSVKNIDNPLVLQLTKGSLLMIVQDYKTALKELKKAQKMAAKNSAASAQVKELMLLCQLSATPVQGTKLAKNMQAFLMKTKKTEAEKRLMFAIGRTLEFQENTTLAALIYSYINESDDYQEQFYWQTPGHRSHSWYQDYYYDYLQYVEMEYSPEALADLIEVIEKNKKQDSFNQWLLEDKQQDLPQLYNLLGTRYIQQNKLELALQNFEKVPNSVWEAAPYSVYMAANPFYTNMYLEHEKRDADTVVYTKVSFTQKLIEYQAKAADETNPERDYYYFLLGTAYFNMTQYGNTWMMRRSFWSASESPYGLGDEDEFYQCLLPQQYFIKAAELTKVTEFKSLCLAMAGRCKQYEINYYNRMKERAEWDKSIKLGPAPDEANSYFKLLERTSPDDYEELISNCYAFDRYVASRQK